MGTSNVGKICWLGVLYPSYILLEKGLVIKSNEASNVDIWGTSWWTGDLLYICQFYIHFKRDIFDVQTRVMVVTFTVK